MPRLTSTTGVRSVDIVDAEIVNADVSTTAAIAHSKLANITAASVLLGNASNVPTATALTGDVTVTSTGVTALASIAGALDHNGSTVGFFGVAPAARPVAYTASNVTTDRAYDANATTLDEIADVLGTLIADLRTMGLVT